MGEKKPTTAAWIVSPTDTGDTLNNLSIEVTGEGLQNLIAAEFVKIDGSEEFILNVYTEFTSGEPNQTLAIGVSGNYKYTEDDTDDFVALMHHSGGSGGQVRVKGTVVDPDKEE